MGVLSRFLGYDQELLALRRREVDALEALAWRNGAAPQVPVDLQTLASSLAAPPPLHDGTVAVAFAMPGKGAGQPSTLTFYAAFWTHEQALAWCDRAKGDGCIYSITVVPLLDDKKGGANVG
jgi:hypothetical protein